MNISKEYLQQSIALNFDYGMHFELMLDGKRRLTEIVEYIGYENGKLIYTPLYLFNVKEIKEFQDEHDQTKFIINGSHERVGKLSGRMIKELKFKGIKTSELEVTKELPVVKEGEKLIGIS
ncbi:hypothetical protein P4213_27395 [Bacillus thuringiensis]|nr:hypothetical protein [Bacillus thuringiensis]